jgi:hypothetical protein
MFHITPPYPVGLTRRFAPLMTGVLAGWSAFILADWAMGVTVAGIALAIGLIVLAAATLSLLAQRRRKIGDPTLGYWRISMVSLLAGAAVWLLTRWIPALATSPQVELGLGILLIFGFAVAVINGMLYKIVPFLAWFHLQAQLLGRAKAPNIKQLLPDAPVRRQWWASLAALLLLIPQRWLWAQPGHGWASTCSAWQGFISDIVLSSEPAPGLCNVPLPLREGEQDIRTV